MKPPAEHQLHQLSIPALIGLAQKNGIRGVTKKKKDDVIKVIASRWDLIKDQIPQLLEEKNKNAQITTEKRSEKGKITKLMKDWGFELRKGSHVIIRFNIGYNPHMGDNGEPIENYAHLRAEGEVFGIRQDSILVKLTSSQTTDALNSPLASPKIGACYEFFWRGRQMLAKDYYTMPKFHTSGSYFSAKLVTPYDEHPVYKEDQN